MDGAPILNNLWELFFQNILSNFFANFYVKILIFIKKIKTFPDTPVWDLTWHLRIRSILRVL